MHPHLDVALLLRHHAAEIDRMVAAQHRRSRVPGRAGARRSPITRVLRQLRAA